MPGETHTPRRYTARSPWQAFHGSDWSKWLGSTNNIDKHADEMCSHVERAAPKMDACFGLSVLFFGPLQSKRPRHMSLRYISESVPRSTPRTRLRVEIQGSSRDKTS
ncbi:unnamed protein product [Lota lota]